MSVNTTVSQLTIAVRLGFQGSDEIAAVTARNYICTNDEPRDNHGAIVHMLVNDRYNGLPHIIQKELERLFAQGEPLQAHIDCINKAKGFHAHLHEYATDF